MFLVFNTIFSRTLNITLSITISFFTALFMLGMPHTAIISGSFALFGWSPSFFSSVYDIILSSIFAMSFVQLFVLLVFVILFGINIIIFVIYARRYRKELSVAGTSLSFSGMLLGMFGVGCLSCSVLILAPLISFIGLGATTWLVEHQLFISIISLILVLVSLIILLKKIGKDELTCSVILDN